MRSKVRIAPAGVEFVADPGEALLDAALRQGVALAYGCRNGVCRSCRARILSGRVGYPRGRPEGLTADDERRGFALLCAACALGDLELEADLVEGADAVRSLPVRLVAKRILAHDVVGLHLQLPAGQAMHFRAGQYVDIIMRDGRRRAFSIASPPQDPATIELHVRRVAGGEFSEYAFDHLKERALLRIRGPLGSFFLRKDRGLPVVMVAGGTGFAPIKSILEDALAGGFAEPIHLYRGARARRDLYLEERVEEWCRRHPALRYVPVLSEPGAEDRWGGRRGLVHEAVLEDFASLAGHAVYLCGPPPMVAAGREAFIARGVDPGDVHADAFEPAHHTGHDR